MQCFVIWLHVHSDVGAGGYWDNLLCVRHWHVYGASLVLESSQMTSMSYTAVTNYCRHPVASNESFAVSDTCNLQCCLQPDSDTSACLDCPMGSYQDSSAQTTCTPCPVDTYSVRPLTSDFVCNVSTNVASPAAPCVSPPPISLPHEHVLKHALQVRRESTEVHGMHAGLHWTRKMHVVWRWHFYTGEFIGLPA